MSLDKGNKDDDKNVYSELGNYVNKYFTKILLNAWEALWLYIIFHIHM